MKPIVLKKYNAYSTQKSKFMALLIMILAFSFLGCGSSKKVPVTNQGQYSNGLNSVPNQPGAAGPSLALLHPQSGQAVPTTISMANGDTVHLSIRLQGFPTQDVSFGYISQSNLGIHIQGQQVTLLNVPEGLHTFSIIARSSRDCEMLRRENCRPNGGIVTSVQNYDVEQKYVLSAVNPQVEFAKIQSSGGGLIGQVSRGDGILGVLGQMFMGGMMGGGQQSGMIGQ